jgi:hypothetical protein
MREVFAVLIAILGGVFAGFTVGNGLAEGRTPVEMHIIWEDAQTTEGGVRIFETTEYTMPERSVEAFADEMIRSQRVRRIDVCRFKLVQNTETTDLYLQDCQMHFQVASPGQHT